MRHVFFLIGPAGMGASPRGTIALITVAAIIVPAGVRRTGMPRSKPFAAIGPVMPSSAAGEIAVSKTGHGITAMTGLVQEYIQFLFQKSQMIHDFF